MIEYYLELDKKLPSVLACPIDVKESGKSNYKTSLPEPVQMKKWKLMATPSTKATQMEVFLLEMPEWTNEYLQRRMNQWMTTQLSPGDAKAVTTACWKLKKKINVGRKITVSERSNEWTIGQPPWHPDTGCYAFKYSLRRVAVPKVSTSAQHHREWRRVAAPKVSTSAQHGREWRRIAAPKVSTSAQHRQEWRRVAAPKVSMSAQHRWEWKRVATPKVSTSAQHRREAIVDWPGRGLLSPRLIHERHIYYGSHPAHKSY